MTTPTCIKRSFDGLLVREVFEQGAWEWRERIGWLTRNGYTHSTQSLGRWNTGSGTILLVEVCIHCRSEEAVHGLPLIPATGFGDGTRQ